MLVLMLIDLVGFFGFGIEPLCCFLIFSWGFAEFYQLFVAKSERTLHNLGGQTKSKGIILSKHDSATFTWFDGD